MLFNSFGFLFFFAVVMALHFVLPNRFRWILLLAASFFFYLSSKPGYILVLILSVSINYYAGLQMGKSETPSRKKKFLIFSILSNLSLLFLFKYYDFLNGSLGSLFAHFNLSYGIPALNLFLPVGISFYTFKNLSYSIDVYRGDKTPETHAGFYALYVAFFPQLLAGPIERATRLLPQFYEKRDFDYDRVTNGLRLMLWGLFQKMVIADTLATLVDPVYSNPTHYQGMSLMMATVFFAFQIYCDFSGYSDIAIGAAQVMGYETMRNFDHPYFSKSIQEFWRRWHISLSTWFRDYFYIPLGGNRVSIPRWYFNLFIVLLICGFWHGANWTFMAWGALHGFYLVFSLFTRRMRARMIQAIKLDQFPKVHHSLQVLVTFVFVSFAWIFFRANNLSDALYIVSHLFAGWSSLFNLRVLEASISFIPSRFELITGVASVAVLIIAHLIEGDGNITKRISEKPIWVRWTVYYSTLSAILLFGNFGLKQFIYFQF